MVIGIVAKKFSGKSTVADILCKELNAMKLAFGTPVKEECIEFLDSEGAMYYPGHFYGNDKDKNKEIVLRGDIPEELLTHGFLDICEPSPPEDPRYLTTTYRKIMQWWGTEYRRKQDENYWNEKMLEAISEVPEGMHIVIDDVRFVDEARLIKTLGGLILKIDRKIDHVDNHRSEMELEMIRPHFTLKNNMSLEHLEKLCMEISDLINSNCSAVN